MKASMELNNDLLHLALNRRSGLLHFPSHTRGCDLHFSVAGVFRGILTLFIVLIFPSLLFAKDYMALSQKLADLRVEVESLNQNIEEERKRYKDQLESYILQKAELGATIRKEEIRREQLKLKADALRADISKNKQGNLDFKPLVFTYIEKLSSAIKESLPFRKAERLSNLKKIRDDLGGGDINSHQAFARWWSAFEDEKRLSRENQLSRETISVDGTSYLAEVVHLGSIQIFFRLEDGTYGVGLPHSSLPSGQVKDRSDSHWSFVILKDKSQIVASEELFSGIKKQIRVGEYLIPLNF